MPSIFDQMRDRFRRTEQKQPDKSKEREEQEARLWEFFLRTALFDLDWYKQQNSDVVAAGVDVVDHFRQFGWKEGRWPNPLFDPTWYLSKNPDVAKAGLNPILHYWIYGEKENRKPHPLFDPSWYRQAYATEVGNSSLLGHYLKHRGTKKYSPNSLFDIEFYLKTQPDVAAADVDPFIHFTTTGYKEGRNPNPSFNVQYYLQQHMQSDPRDPITHYFEVGLAAGFSMVPVERVSSQSSEIRKYSKPSSDFEEVNPNLARGLPRRAKVLAYYLPQFHTFPENDKWWGKGFTEWTNVGRGTPRFVGHYQPRIPRDFGFYNLEDQRILPLQIEAAKSAGLYGFCFYYYNFNGKRLLEKPVEDFLRRQELDFPFCLMWANENWTRRWDGAESELLMKQDYREEDAEGLVDDFARHFEDHRYIRVGGRPLLFIYRADIIPNTRDTIRRWRELFMERHDVSPLIFMAQSFGNHDPHEFGFDGAIEFPPHKVVVGADVANSECHVFDNNFSARVYKYEDIINSAKRETAATFPLIKTVFPSWDNDARRQGQGMSVIGSSPALYMDWLDHVIRYANQNPVFGERFVCINAWNEWAEGAYLEPDVHFGGAYLNATARVITGLGGATRKQKIALVGHNAFPAGAQTLLLELAKTIRQQFGMDVSVLLCAGGKMADAYQAVCPTRIVTEALTLEAAVKQICEDAIDGAIVNSVGSGSAAAYLKNSGAKVVSLVHEMPRLMEENHLVAYAKEMAKHSDEVVFPSPIVRDKFIETIGPASGAMSIRPQGIYSRLDHIPDSKGSLLAELGLPEHYRVVLNVGYGDLRKGIDTFCAVAKLVSKSRPDIVFVWAGDIHLHLRSWINDPAANPNVKFLGQRSDVSRLMSASDVFALTSREDPFPSVVLEAQSLGVPVVCFGESGGAADLVAANGFGSTVAFGDIVEYSQAILAWLDKGDDIKQPMGKKISEVMRSSYAFDLYAFELAQRILPELRTISVIVPNYNYAKHLESRLRSIFDQTYPVLEIIVLDDCSQDDSIAVCEEFSSSSSRIVKVVKNGSNSGSPFLQWRKGLSLARGELIWIAEADDLSDPDFLAKLASAFLREDTLFAFSDSKPIDSDSNPMEMNYKSYYAKAFEGALSEDFVSSAKEFARRHLSQRNLILNVSSMLWKRDALVQAMDQATDLLGDYKLAGDWLIYLIACTQEGSVTYVSSELNTHRRHLAGVTSSTKGSKQIEEVMLIHKHFNSTFGEDEETLRKQVGYIEELREQFEIK